MPVILDPDGYDLWLALRLIEGQPPPCYSLYDFAVSGDHSTAPKCAT
jgi:hypothetical protein